MSSTLKTLATVLEQMSSLYSRIVEVLGEEQKALVKCDFELMLQIARDKDEWMSTFRSLDKERIKLQDRWVLENNFSFPNVSLLEIINDLDQSNDSIVRTAASQLRHLREEIRRQMSEIEVLVDNNRVLTESGIAMMRGIAESVSGLTSIKEQRSERKAATYNQKAKVQSSKKTSGRIIERRY
jgi:flagellar biosynthesis/type III secretory pathway chaperone